jgi:hypothetical protein
MATKSSGIGAMLSVVSKTLTRSLSITAGAGSAAKTGDAGALNRARPNEAIRTSTPRFRIFPPSLIVIFKEPFALTPTAFDLRSTLNVTVARPGSKPTAGAFRLLPAGIAWHVIPETFVHKRQALGVRARHLVIFESI